IAGMRAIIAARREVKYVHAELTLYCTIQCGRRAKLCGLLEFRQRSRPRRRPDGARWPEREEEGEGQRENQLLQGIECRERFDREKCSQTPSMEGTPVDSAFKKRRCQPKGRERAKEP